MPRNDDMHDDDGDAKSAAAKLARQQWAQDVKWLMSQKQGRRIAWRLLERAGVYRNSFTGNSETFFREGQRSQGLALLDDITTHAPESFAQMFTEAKAPTA